MDQYLYPSSFRKAVRKFVRRTGLLSSHSHAIAPAKHRYEYKPPCYPLEHSSDDYNTINSIAHRGWVPRFYAPALTWHRAFWLRDIYEEETVTEGGQTIPAADYVRRSLDKAVLAFYVGIKSLENNHIPIRIFPNVENLDPLSPNKHVLLFGGAIDASSISSDPSYIPPNLLKKRERDVLDSIGRVVAIVFSINNISFTVRVELRDEYFCISTIASYSDSNERDDQHFTHVQGFDDRDTDQFVRAINNLCKFMCDESDALESEVPDYIYRVFWPDFIGKIAAITNTTCAFHGRIFANLFADFRGIVISNETIGQRMADHKKMRGGEWGYTIDQKIRQLLHFSEEYEVSASYGLQKRALYISSVGPQPAEYPECEIVPVEYVVFVQQDKKFDLLRGVNQWQLGSFIDKLHVSGTLRLAALKYYPKLLEIGSGISRIDELIAKATDAISEIGVEAKEDIKKAHDEFDKVAKAFSGDEVAGAFTLVPGRKSGVLYRIDRSRYYIKQFRDNLVALRCEPIDGYQRYDEFIERRLGPLFDFIDILGVRYERILKALNSLDQALIAAESVKVSKSIEEIQKDGELILFLFPVPYYWGLLLEHTLAKPYAELGIIAVWIACVCFAVARRRKTFLRGFAGVSTTLLILLSVFYVLHANEMLKIDEHEISAPHTEESQLLGREAPLRQQMESETVKEQLSGLFSCLKGIDIGSGALAFVRCPRTYP